MLCRVEQPPFFRGSVEGVKRSTVDSQRTTEVGQQQYPQECPPEADPGEKVATPSNQVSNIVILNQVGGRLKPFLHNWRSLTSELHILQAVQGYKIEFDAELPPPPPPLRAKPLYPYRWNTDEKENNFKECRFAEIFSEALSDTLIQYFLVLYDVLL